MDGIYTEHTYPSRAYNSSLFCFLRSQKTMAFFYVWMFCVQQSIDWKMARYRKCVHPSQYIFRVSLSGRTKVTGIQRSEQWEKISIHTKIPRKKWSEMTKGKMDKKPRRKYRNLLMCRKLNFLLPRIDWHRFVPTILFRRNRFVAMKDFYPKKNNIARIYFSFCQTLHVHTIHYYM